MFFLSLSTLAEKLLGQLLHSPTEELFSERCLAKRIQFRYHFIVERILSEEILQGIDENELNTG
ncbi:MAG: hypothetical protein ACHQUC_09355 [Chlamydiales bacterium]